MNPADDLRALIENQRADLVGEIKRVGERNDKELLDVQAQLVALWDYVKRQPVGYEAWLSTQKAKP